MAKNNKKTKITPDELEQITFDAMRVHGVLPPTVEEVAAFDAELSDVDLPFGASDPEELLKKLETEVDADEQEVILPFTTMEETSRNLARAARQGGELTEDIERRMADDKAKLLQDEHDKE
ncbi:MAG: hypothetical protein MPJ50_09405 [Pirellulales bacterium]|nr:hypothetical protein [Pirellulales bacterium]